MKEKHYDKKVIGLYIDENLYESIGTKLTRSEWKKLKEDIIALIKERVEKDK